METKIQKVISEVLTPQQIMQERQTHLQVLTKLPDYLITSTVEKWSGAAAQTAMAEVSIDDIAGRDDLPTIGSIRSSGGSSAAISIVSSHIVSLYKFANLEVEPGGDIETIMLIVSNYYYLNVAELAKFFSELKAGVFGQFIWGSRINSQQVLSYLNEFVRNQRNKAIDRVEKKKLDQEKQRGYSTINSFGTGIVSGLDSFRKLQEEAKKDYNVFRKIYPKTDAEKGQIYWKGWCGHVGVLSDLYPGHEPKEAHKRLCDYLFSLQQND